MKRAMPRIFRHLGNEQRITVLTMIVVHLDTLDVVRHGVYHPDETQLPSAHREEIDVFSNHVLPPLLGYMYEAPINIVIGLLGIMLDRVDIQLISMTKIGLQFLTMFFSRAEIIKQSVPQQMDEQDHHDWQVIYDRIFNTLNGHWNSCFPPNGKFVDDQYVWQFLASIAVGATMQQQQTLVSSVKYVFILRGCLEGPRANFGRIGIGCSRMCKQARSCPRKSVCRSAKMSTSS